MIKLYRYLKYYKKEVIFGPFFKLLEAILELLIPFVMTKYIMAHMDKGPSFILYSGFILILIGLIGLFFSLCCQRMASRASQGFGTRVRHDLFKHIQSLSYKELDKIAASSLLMRMSDDINQVQTSVAMLIRLVVRAPFLVVGGIVMSYITTKNIYITLIFLFTSILISIVSFIIMKSSVPSLKKSQVGLDRVTCITKENIEGARVVRAFGNETFEKNKFEEETRGLKKLNLFIYRLSSLLNPLTYILLNLGIMAILYFGGFSLGISGNEAIALVQYMNQILVALLVVANLVVIFTKAQASSERINEVFEIQPSIISGDISSGIDFSKVEFKSVSFGYNEDKNTIKNICFSLKPNDILGIIGPTGSGKTTIVSLLLRLYEASTGKILINDHLIQEFDLGYLREQIGFVPQNPVLLSGTIKSNLLIKNKLATSIAIDKALYTSMSQDIVNNKEDGIDCVVDSSGKNFSGGQVARLSIARAIINEPKILILDDSSCALDYETDAFMQQRLKEQFKDKILIIVSQRIRTIKNANKIVVIQEGQIVGNGTSDELLKSCPVYKEIAKTQEELGDSYE